MSNKVINKRIDPNKWYGLLDIVEQGLFAWCKDVKTVRSWIHRDKLTKDKLKAVIVGQGRQARYHIKGSNIIEFLVNVEDGSYLN